MTSILSARRKTRGIILEDIVVRLQTPYIELPRNQNVVFLAEEEEQFLHLTNVKVVGPWKLEQPIIQVRILASNQALMQELEASLQVPSFASSIPHHQTRDEALRPPFYLRKADILSLRHNNYLPTYACA